MTDRRRAKALRRKHREEKRSGRDERAPEAVLQEIVNREVLNGERYLVHLQRFAELLHSPLLARMRFAPKDVLDAIRAFRSEEHDAAADAGRYKAFHEALLSELATREVWGRFETLFAEVLPGVTSEEDLMALLVARLSLGHRRGRLPAFDTPMWLAILMPSVAEVIRGGGGLVLAVRDAQGDLPVEELDVGSLELSEVLHLVRASALFEEKHFETIFDHGLTPEVRRAALDAFDGAFRRDVTPEVVADLARELEEWADDEDPGRETDHAARRRALAIAASVRAVSIETSPLLRALYLRSFELHAQLAGHSEPFVAKLWDDPGDARGIEEYERSLREEGDFLRARRVRRYRDALAATPAVPAPALVRP